MRGEVLSLDDGGSGLISGDDGARYSFGASDVSGSVQVRDRVDFVGTDGVATDIMVLAGSSPRPSDGLSATDTSGPKGFDFGSALFSFSGRLRRSHFWISWIIMVAVWWLTFFIPFVNLAAQLGLLWTNLAVGAKRFHDMGKPGWLIAIPWVLLILTQIALFASIGVSAMNNPEVLESEDPAAIMAMMGPALFASLIAVPVSLAFWLWLGIADSQPGSNKYGPNPKGL